MDNFQFDRKKVRIKNEIKSPARSLREEKRSGVETIGIEPTTSALQRRRTLPVELRPHVEKIFCSKAKATLLGYSVGVLGFEPRTSSLSATHSNQLSYTPYP